MSTSRTTPRSIAAIVASILCVSLPVLAEAGPSAPRHETRASVNVAFDRDYSDALSVDQMIAAWDAEIERLFPAPGTGGG